jgi:RNA polymerase sigma-70 factor (ECF subfamily)
MTDAAIIELFFERNENAILFCDEKYGARLRSFGKRMTADSEITEECVDDTYVKTWNTVPPKDPRDYLFAFLSKIMRHRCIDRIRSIDREKRGAAITSLSSELTEAAPSGDSSDSVALRNELSALISDFLGGVKNEWREIFVMRYFYMEEISSIARHLDMTEGKVKTVLKRTRDALRLHLEGFGYRA